MALWQGRSTRKITGGRLRRHRKKRKREMGREQIEIKLGESKSKKIKARGNNYKIRLINAEYAEIVDPKTKKSEKVKILSVIENTANPHYVRRNVITKGAIIETEKGKARVTSRPGQEGSVSAVLL